MEQTAEHVTSARLTSFILTDDGQPGESVRRLKLERPGLWCVAPTQGR